MFSLFLTVIVYYYLVYEPRTNLLNVIFVMAGLFATKYIRNFPKHHSFLNMFLRFLLYMFAWATFSLSSIRSYLIAVLIIFVLHFLLSIVLDSLFISDHESEE